MLQTPGNHRQSAATGRHQAPYCCSGSKRSCKAIRAQAGDWRIFFVENVSDGPDTNPNRRAPKELPREGPRICRLEFDFRHHGTKGTANEDESPGELVPRSKTWSVKCLNTIAVL